VKSARLSDYALADCRGCVNYSRLVTGKCFQCPSCPGDGESDLTVICRHCGGKGCSWRKNTGEEKLVGYSGFYYSDKRPL
jgi:hypothetical protein